jgi:hypothetical protein
MIAFANSLTEKLTSWGNGVTILMVLFIVTLVLSLAFLAVRWLNREVDKDATLSG